MATDIFLRAGEASPNDVKLRDTTLSDGTAHEETFNDSFTLAEAIVLDAGLAEADTFILTEPFSTEYSDNFNRADSNTLGLSWVEVETNAANFRISSNKLSLLFIPPPTAFAYWNKSTIADQFSQITISSLPTMDIGCGPAVRIDSTGTVASATLYVAIVEGATQGGGVSLRKYVAEGLTGAGTTLGVDATVNINGDVIRIEVVGSQITVKRNGSVVIGPITDTDIVSGYVGMTAVGSLFQGPTFDDWSGGVISVTKDVGMFPADTYSLIDSLVKDARTNLADTFSLADALVKDVGLSESDAYSLADALIKDAGISQTDAFSLVDAIAQAISLAKSDSFTLTDAQVKDVAMSIADSFSLTDEATFDLVLGITEYLNRMLRGLG